MVGATQAVVKILCPRQLADRLALFWPPADTIGWHWKGPAQGPFLLLIVVPDFDDTKLARTIVRVATCINVVRDFQG